MVFLTFLEKTVELYTSFFNKRPFYESLLLGALSGFIHFPIIGIQLVLFLTLSRFMILVDEERPFVKALFVLWGFFAGYFFTSLYWISHAFTFELAAFWWAIPFCLLGVPAFLAFIPTAIGPWFMGWSYKAPNKFLRLVFLQFGQGEHYAIVRLLMIATWIGTFEFLVDDFFPWAAFGNTWASVLVIGQTAALGGVFTLSFLTVSLMCIPYLWMTKTDTKGRLVYAVVGGIALLGMLVYGGIRLSQPPVSTATTIRLVQPGIPNRLVWNPQEHSQDLNHLVALSRVQTKPVTAIVWPEATVRFSLDQGSSLPEELAQFLVGQSDYLITGAVRRDGEKVWNSMYIIGQKGVLGKPYDKHHLVPFGEYIPGRSWIERMFGIKNLRKVSAGMQDFSCGKGPGFFKADKLPAFSPMICYEAIFPGRVVGRDMTPTWLLHLTEDSWFGQSVGPYQHFQISRMRAIEEGVPVVRVANTGISGVIDPFGRIVATMPLGHVGFIDVALPQHLPEPTLAKTFYRFMAWIDEVSSFSSLVS